MGAKTKAKPTPTATPAVDRPTREGVKAVLKRISKRFVAFDDAYQPWAPKEKAELVDELAAVFAKARDKAADAK